MNDPESLLGMNNEILLEIYQLANTFKNILDPYYKTHLKKCDTHGRIWEIALLKHLDSLNLPIEKHETIDFILTFKETSILIEVTAPEIKLDGETDPHKISCAIECIIKAIDKKMKQYKEIKSLKNSPFIIAISLIKSKTLTIHHPYREIILQKIQKYLTGKPYVSAVILAWDWPYWFPEIAQKYLGVIIKQPNDFCLIDNINACHPIPKDLDLQCDRILFSS
ncbi:MAG: hypothetical protein ABSF18_05010 [Gammaproteobacteria bacterium]